MGLTLHGGQPLRCLDAATVQLATRQTTAALALDRVADLAARADHALECVNT